MNLAELTQVALLGTERQPLNVTPSRATLAALQSQIDLNLREHALLSLAALCASHERAGKLPWRDKAPLAEPCPPEQQPIVSAAANSLLLRILDGEFEELLPEWLILAARARQIAMPETLPALLNKGNSALNLREPILSVIGQRGLWLAAQNTDWAWVGGAASDDENVWRTGEHEARLMFLKRLRATHPARARELVMESWKQETPEDRATFIAAFETSLSAEDEEFLELALDDKRKEVRKRAAALLARIPNSRLSQRMIDRARTLLKFIPSETSSILRMKKARPASIEVTLPAECDKPMQRDGIEPKPQSGFGEKAWWLIQMIEAVPLDFWVQEWHISPEIIVSASLQGEWSKELFEAWSRAAVRQQNAAWASEVFDAAVVLQRWDKLEALLAAMLPAHREERLTVLLENNKGGDIQRTLISQSNHQWGVKFSRAVLTFMRRETSQMSGNWALRTNFKTFASHLAPEVFAEAATGWPVASQAWEFWSKGVEEFLSVVQFRSDLRNAFATKT